MLQLNRKVIRGSRINLQVLNRNAAAKISPDVPYIMISTIDVDSEDNVFEDNDNCKGIICRRFEDEDDSTRKYAPNAIDGSAIASFVKHYIDEVELIICHCEAGMCRSAGVAAAISKWANGDDEYFFTGDGGFIPNKLVYRLVLSSLMEE
jgi:predicted protein tyrosine phosphatase